MTALIYRDRSAVIIWLSAAAFLVCCMVVVGGYTRLSGSGLSITRWEPIHGSIPPVSDAQWQEEFAAYQQTPQYQQVNKGIGLDEFKEIFWPEYIHRLLGRVAGAVFLIPLIIFAARRSITPKLGWRLAGIFTLGLLQGLIGWLMVKSGLQNNPNVSPVRLATHLIVALAILVLILWTLMDIKYPHRAPVFSRGPAAGYLLWFHLLIVQIILGALMAGFHAGLVYNTWPLMNGHFFPEELFSDTLTQIQFLHRNIAVLLALGFLFWWRAWRIYVKQTGLVGLCLRIGLALAAQFVLGVVTLVHDVPMPLALLHQTLAVMLFILSLVLLHRLVRS